MTAAEIREVVRATLSGLLSANVDGASSGGTVCAVGALLAATPSSATSSCATPSSAAPLSTLHSPLSIPLEVSARHVHLTQTALETLFGAGAELGQKRALSQPGEFLSDKRVKITTPDGEIHGAAVLGPVRSAVQVELSQSDCRKLKLDAPVRLSGDLSGAADVTLQGTAGKYTAHGAAIIAKNHMHCTPAEAARLGIADGQSVNVRVNTARPVIFEDVPVRVRETFSLAMHLDTDEANACALAAGNVGTLIDCGTAPAQCAANPDAAIPSPAANEPKPIICEKLISENRAKELIKSGGTVIFAAGTILTPSAKDIFLHAHVRVEFV